MTKPYAYQPWQGVLLREVWKALRRLPGRLVCWVQHRGTWKPFGCGRHHRRWWCRRCGREWVRLLGA